MTPLAAMPWAVWKLAQVGGGLGAEGAGGFLGRDRARQVLLHPQHLIALAAAAQFRVGAVGRDARERRQRRGQRAPQRRRGFLPVPEGHAGGAVVDGLLAEAQHFRGRDVAVGLPEREQRAPVDAVGDVGVGIHGVDRAADVLPVHLRRVVLGPVRPQEHRVGEGGVVGDVGEGGEAQRVVGAHFGAQVGDVGLRGGVVAFVLGLGVDHQAVGAVGHGLGAEFGLAGRVGAVDVLPGARLQAVGVQFGHQLRRRTGSSSCWRRRSS